MKDVIVHTLSLVAFSFVLLFISCSDEKEDCPEKEMHRLCECAANYEPVCGCNGKTYTNSCVAYCSGIENYFEGECP